MNSQRLQRGVSLIEALVAVAVLAFGVIGIAGMQLGLRQNSDTSKQRSEAVRIAQAAIEDARDYSVIETDGVWRAFDDIASIAPTTVPDIASNTTYMLTVTAPAIAASAPRLRRFVADVTWADRTNQPQGPVRLTTLIAGIPPQLAGSTGVPITMSPTRLPGGRHVAVPPGAVDLGNGKSLFTPAGGGGVTWTFDNTSGVITLVCDVTGTCIPGNLFLLAGFVRFAITNLAPSGAQSEMPPGPLPFDLSIVSGVRVDLSSPVVASLDCFTEPFGTDALSYFCAVPTTTATSTTPSSWSGRSQVNISAIASSLSDNDINHFKVCRYTPLPTDTPARGNVDHPLDYTNVTGPLVNQNFLVTRAGNGTAAFACPGDDTSTPYVNGNTYRHLPLT